MAIFKQGNNKCYFIHIPRTGGRYVSSLFENTKNIECEHHKINEKRIQNIDVTHLHYPLYNFYLGVKDIPHITIVRNPCNKFHSCIKSMFYVHGLDYNNILSHWENFQEFVLTEINVSSFHNNWFLPQYNFFSPKTFFWKYEWGFGDNFKSWVYEKTNIELDIKNVKYDFFDGEIQGYFYLDNKIKDYVKRFYQNDYEILGY